MTAKGRKRSFYPSIFNDVLAPLTQGPSSSNTVGPYRIGALSAALLDGKPKHLKVEMSKNGGFPDTFYGMESDKAFLLGVLGKELTGFDIGKVYDTAKAEGLTYEFLFTDRIPAVPSEMGELTLKSDKETLTLTGISMGGGEILIDNVNGIPCSLKGMSEEQVVIDEAGTVRTAPSVYPLTVIKGAVPPFTDSEDMLRYAAENGKPLWQAAIDYERSLTGLDERSVRDVAERTLEAAYASIEAGYRDGITFEGITVAKAADIKKKFYSAENGAGKSGAGDGTQRLIPVGAADRGALDALAVLEYSNSHGIIVCMPTGGAAGIIPAAIRNAAEALGKGRDEQVNALLTAGLIGAYYIDTHYHGAFGCQAEVGIATSMAAGGLASFISDDPCAVERAAVLGMQYTIGQVCDPIEGYPQIPCFIRNAASVPVAMTCANYGVLGLDTAVSLDEMAAAVLRVGEKLREGRINDLGTCGSKYVPNPCSTCGQKKSK